LLCPNVLLIDFNQYLVPHYRLQLLRIWIHYDIHELLHVYHRLVWDVRASALGFMTVSCYTAAGGMTVVGIPFYENMGVHWTLTILGCISAIMTRLPYTFYRYGSVIRNRRFAAHKDGQ
jgi:hypothetical protein